MWMVYDELEVAVFETKHERHDDAIVVVLEQFLPKEIFGEIQWGNSYTGNGVLYYLWAPLLAKGWSIREVSETVESDPQYRSPEWYDLRNRLIVSLPENKTKD